MNDITQLYRHFDASGTLLYVGISCTFPRRTLQHRGAAHWFDKIVLVKIEHYKLRSDAIKAEINAIKEERPLYNATYKRLIELEAEKDNAIKLDKNKYKTTLQWLCAHVEEFLKMNSHITEPGFGLAAIGDTNLVRRLRAGRDITTRKLDALVRYMSNPNEKDNTHDVENKKGSKKVPEQAKQGKGRKDQGERSVSRP